MKHIDLDALQAAAEAAGGDEWGTDTVKNEGEYGAGEDAVSGFDSYCVIDSNENTLLNTLNFDQSEIQEECDDEYFRARDEPARKVAEFVAAVNPAVILALIDRLRKAEADAARYRWLRHGDNDELVIQHGPVEPGYHWLPRNERLDEMIDQHIAAPDGAPPDEKEGV